MREIGLGRYMPVWRGERSDLITVGGEKSQKEESWRDSKHRIPSTVKKKIAARVLETAVIVCMGTHVYTFCDKLYLQQSGGPIGMRFTASLANLIMKKWDTKWQELCEREGLVVDMQLRYVDDCRVFCPFINEGWKWRDGGFHFSWQDRENDLKSGQSDIQRTTLEITNSMCSLVEF